jgi:hypothetical protein
MVNRFALSLWHALAGRPTALPESISAQWPELHTVQWRCGGLALRIGGWLLGQRSVAGVTLWRTVYLAPGIVWEPQLLLHEYRHVVQYAASPFFPVLYCWESLVHGYRGNRYETDANAWAAQRLSDLSSSHLQQGA